MNTRLQAAIALAVIGLSTVAVTHKAQACGMTTLQRNAGQHWSLPMYRPGSNMHTAASQAVGTKQVPRYRNILQLLEPLAGLYEFTFTSDGTGNGPPAGVVVDHGFATWHADGSEIMNSGKPAVGGDFCMGTWAQTGPKTFSLNHYALNWGNALNPDPNNPQDFIGPVNIRENITLAQGNNSYSGAFTLDQYAPDGTTLLAHVQGTVWAT
ncbi:MAG: hypothetical protein ACREIC_09820, partial [Limisphaerales bacterium]